MKIGILSLYLGRNYGGILQQYALSKYLESLGHQVVILNRQYNGGGFVMRMIRKTLKSLGVKRYNQTPRPEYNIQPFIQREFTITSPASSSSQFAKLCKKEGLDAIVYGSDQIWRREFELNYGLDYFGVVTPASAKQIAYAPSFGLDVWEYNASETAQIKESLSRFVALSSREESGVRLIKENLSFDAALVSDPTMLLTAEQYAQISSKPIQNNPYCFVYWLGDEESMKQTIEGCERIKGLKVVTLNLRSTYPLSSIEDWLSYIANADYVITDSFHGTVFSLLFQKQFYIHCNKSGGFSRLETLLKRVGAENKLTNPTEEVDYSTVNTRINDFRNQSQSFLKQALSR